MSSIAGVYCITQDHLAISKLIYVVMQHWKYCGWRETTSSGSNLVQRAIRAMASDDADEVVLETEITNKPALRLYENLGFVRDKRLFR